MAQRKLPTTIFELSYLIVTVRLEVYLSLKKVRPVFLYMLMPCKMCFPLYNFPYQFSQFAVFMEHLKVRKNGGVAINGPPQDSMNGPL